MYRALKEELANFLVVANFATTKKYGRREGFTQIVEVEYYNLDVILSVGYRVNSKNAVYFRRWATNVLKEYLLRGYSINHNLALLEDRLNHRIVRCESRLDEHQKQIDFFVRTSLPPVEGLFYDGQIFDAYIFVSDLIKSARAYLIFTPQPKGFKINFQHKIATP